MEKKKFALSKQQCLGVLETARSYSFLHELMIETQLLTGLRVGELVNLRIEDINLNDNTIQIKEHLKSENVDEWKPKTEFSPRVIPINSTLSMKLSNHLKKNDQTNGYFFTSRKGCAFAIESVISFINKYARETKSLKKNIGSHALRRTFASFMLSDGHSIWEVSRLLGHSSIKFTIVYLFGMNNNDNYNEIRESQMKMIT